MFTNECIIALHNKSYKAMKLENTHWVDWLSLVCIIAPNLGLELHTRSQSSNWLLTTEEPQWGSLGSFYRSWWTVHVSGSRFSPDTGILMTGSNLRALSQSLASLVIVKHWEWLCFHFTVHLSLKLFVRTNLNENLLLALPLQNTLHLHLQKVRVSVCAHVRRHCSQGLHFKRIKNTPDSPARIINHRNHARCTWVCVSVCDKDRAKDSGSWKCSQGKYGAVRETKMCTCSWECGLRLCVCTGELES